MRGQKNPVGHLSFDPCIQTERFHPISALLLLLYPLDFVESTLAYPGRFTPLGLISEASFGKAQL